MAFPALTTLLGHLRSANTRALVLRRTKTAIGIREFAVSAAVVWNSLPPGTTNAVLFSTNFCAKTKETPV